MDIEARETYTVKLDNATAWYNDSTNKINSLTMIEDEVELVVYNSIPKRYRRDFFLCMNWGLYFESLAARGIVDDILFYDRINDKYYTYKDGCRDIMDKFTDQNNYSTMINETYDIYIVDNERF